MDIEVHRFSSQRRADFYGLHCDANDAGWCFCAAWWVPTWEGWGERTAEDNRGVREMLCEAGEYDGYLLYVDGHPAGWCQVGPRDRLAKLCRQFALSPSPEVWAITCFLIAPQRRRSGLATQLLKEALADLRVRGARRVEAFPRRGAGLSTGDLWNGPEGIFLRAGFMVAREDAQRPILAIELMPDEFEGRSEA